jgi:nicotinate-nucleotide adenylyltransferase
MTALAVAADQRLLVSDLEMESQGPSYTIDTLERLERSGVDASQICFVTGADAFRDIGSWKSHEELLARCRFAVVSRPGLSAFALQDLLPGLADRMLVAGTASATGAPAITLVDAVTSPVSSTAVRDAVQAGLPLTDLVPPAVAAHVDRHRLYRVKSHALR